MQFVHLPEAAMRATGRATGAEVALLPPAERWRVGQRLQGLVRQGRLSPRGILRALGNGPRGGDWRLLATLGAAQARQRRRLVRPRLPPALRAHAHPQFSSQRALRALTLWAEVMLRLCGTAGFRHALSGNPGRLANWLDTAHARHIAAVRATLPAACRRLAGKPRGPGSWDVAPACFYNTEYVEPEAVVVEPTGRGGCGFGYTALDLRPDTPALEEIVRGIGAFRTRAPALMSPVELITDFGGYAEEAREEFREHASEFAQPDGSVVFPDEFVQRMNEEYGIELEDPESRTVWTEYIRFARDLLPRFERPCGDGTTRDPAAYFVVAAAAYRGKRRRLLLALARLSEWHAARVTALAGQEPRMHLDPVNEEDYIVGVHVVRGRLGGIDETAAADLDELMMSNGGSGGLACNAGSAEKTWLLCVLDLVTVECAMALLEQGWGDPA